MKSNTDNTAIAILTAFNFQASTKYSIYKNTEKVMIGYVSQDDNIC